MAFDQPGLKIGVGPVERQRLIETAEAIKRVPRNGKTPAFEESAGRKDS